MTYVFVKGFKGYVLTPTTELSKTSNVSVSNAYFEGNKLVKCGKFVQVKFQLK